MRSAILSCVFFLAVAALPGMFAAYAQSIRELEPTMPMRKELTIERLYASPSLSGPTIQSVKYSPDGSRVTFLRARPDDRLRFDLWQFDVETGEQSMLVDSKRLDPSETELSEEEKALRERKRISGRSGIVDYDWGPNDTLLIPSGGDIFLVQLTNGESQIERLTQTETFEYDARLSGTGKFASFVRDGAVYAIDLRTKMEHRLTPQAKPEHTISYGVSEYVAQEEIDRFTGYWWGPGDAYIAYTRVDESGVDIIPRFDISSEGTTVVHQRYPRAGRPNAHVELWVRDIESGQTTKIASVGPDTYLARVNWAPDSLWYQTQDREQKNITYHRAGKEDWTAQEVFSEHQESWTNLSNDFAYLHGKVLYSDESTGFRHLYVGDTAGTDFSSTPLTEGDWTVSRIEKVSSRTETIFFTGFADTPLEKHLYRTSYSRAFDDGDELPDTPAIRITEAGKTWSIVMSPNADTFVGTSSSPNQPPQVGLYRSSGTLIAWIEENALNDDHPYTPYLDQHAAPQFGTLQASDGQPLQYSILLPSGFDPAKQYPALVDVYGGPHAQDVDKNWPALADQFFARKGFIVFRLDNRGTYNRGKAFEDVIYKTIGAPEVEDQLLGVNWLKSQPFVDPDRVAIQGWSYGGYMTLMVMLKAPAGTFAAAVAGAPVTDWRLYDTHYTERYLGLPDDNPEVYQATSVFPYLERLSTPLLLVHGMADDNVTFDNTTRLMSRLQELGKPFELMTYPGQRHGIRGEALQSHLMQTRIEFLGRHLGETGE